MQDQYVSFSAAWFTLSLINAGLAQAKQRSGLNWWFISLFIGPFATLMIVAWPPGQGVQRPAPGTMSQRQALIIGAGVIVLIFGVFAVFQFAGAP